MSHRKIEALGRPRRSDAQPPRLLALRQRHHFRKVAGTTESLFDCRDGLALLQRAAVGHRLVQQVWHSHRSWTKFRGPHTFNVEDCGSTGSGNPFSVLQGGLSLSILLFLFLLLGCEGEGVPAPQPGRASAPGLLPPFLFPSVP